MQKAEVISDSPSGICSTGRERDGGKVLWEEEGLVYGDPREKVPGLYSWEIWTREGREQTYKKI